VGVGVMPGVGMAVGAAVGVGVALGVGVGVGDGVAETQVAEALRACVIWRSHQAGSAEAQSPPQVKPSLPEAERIWIGFPRG
jgi:hypothetical protein